MTTKGIWATSVAALLGLLLPAWPAIADEPDSFTACIGPVQSDHCSTDDTYLAGDDLSFRGTVEPAHAGMTAKARVKAPGDDRFRTVAIDAVSDEGAMRWTWKTDVSDANIEVYMPAVDDPEPREERGRAGAADRLGRPVRPPAGCSLEGGLRHETARARGHGLEQLQRDLGLRL